MKRASLILLIILMGMTAAKAEEREIYVSDNQEITLIPLINEEYCYWKGIDAQRYELPQITSSNKIVKLSVNRVESETGSLVIITKDGKVFPFTLKRYSGITLDEYTIHSGMAVEPEILQPDDTLYLSNDKITVLNIPRKMNRARYMKEREWRFQIKNATPEIFNGPKGSSTMLVLSINNPDEEPLENTLEFVDNTGNIYTINVKYDPQKAIYYQYLNIDPTKASTPVPTVKNKRRDKNKNRETNTSWQTDETATALLIIMLILAGILAGTTSFLFIRQHKRLKELEVNTDKRINGIINKLNDTIKAYNANLNRIDNSLSSLVTKTNRKDALLTKFADTEEIVKSYFDGEKKKLRRTKLNRTVMDYLKNIVQLETARQSAFGTSSKPRYKSGVKPYIGPGVPVRKRFIHKPVAR